MSFEPDVTIICELLHLLGQAGDRRSQLEFSPPVGLTVGFHDLQGLFQPSGSDDSASPVPLATLRASSSKGCTKMLYQPQRYRVKSERVPTHLISPGLSALHNTASSKLNPSLRAEIIPPSPPKSC